MVVAIKLSSPWFNLMNYSRVRALLIFSYDALHENLSFSFEVPTTLRMILTKNLEKTIFHPIPRGDSRCIVKIAVSHRHREYPLKQSTRICNRNVAILSRLGVTSISVEVAIFKEKNLPSFIHTPSCVNKFVRTTMRLFNAIFFLIYFFHFMDDLFLWNYTIDFKLILLNFAIGFAIFIMWLQTYGWTDG